jgi:hypothetical protein
MKIAFHSNQLGIRGTEVALYDYALHNREILGNESIILSDKNNELSTYGKFNSQFDVLLYDNFSQVQYWVDDRNVDAVYYIKAGTDDGKLVTNAKNLVHTVFQLKQPHGDVYAYVSKWLANHMSNGALPYVPHIVDILNYDHIDNYREYLGIPKSATVFGYYGGSDSFNIDFAKKAVVDVARSNRNIYFLFMNVNTFCDEPNVIYLGGTPDLEKKIGFINTCDACLHARNGGESFGLTVAEFSIKNKPVITTTYCTAELNDLAHIEMLGDKSILYTDYMTLVSILTSFRDIQRTREDWNAYNMYSPQTVMQQFKQVFLT